MVKKENINLDEMFGAASKDGFGTHGFGTNSFGTPYGFGAPYGFAGNLDSGRLPHYATSAKSLEVINNYEDEISKSDSETKEDLIGIDIELGRLSTFSGFGANYSRVKIKEHVANITKRYREAVLALSTVTCVLGTALIIEKIRNKK